MHAMNFFHFEKLLMSHIRSRCALDKKVEKKSKKAVSSRPITNCTIGPLPPSVDSNSLLSRETVHDFHSEHTRRVRLHYLITDVEAVLKFALHIAILVTSFSPSLKLEDPPS